METKTMIAQINDEDVLRRSSSGGVFYYICKYYMQNHNAIVFGSTIDETGKVYHLSINKVSDLDKIMRSKYVESELKNTFNEAKEFLENNRMVVFSGTPCQTNALYYFLITRHVSIDNLLLIDIVCHGTPKKEYWNEYLSSLRINPPYHINFRYKKNGWSDYYIQINDFMESHNSNVYFHNFLKNNILKEKCFTCINKGENRKSDVTLGDAWGPYLMDETTKKEKGLSLVVVRSNKLEIHDIIQKIKIRDVYYPAATFLHNPSYFLPPLKPTDYGKLIFYSIDNNFKTNKKYWIHKQVDFLKKAIHKTVKTIYTYKTQVSSKRNIDIGIITLNGYYNYGNRLQNFALFYLLKKQNYNVVNIVFNDWFDHFWEYCRHKSFRREYSIFKASIRATKKYYVYKNSDSDKPTIINRFLVGSDQVWNYDWPHLFINSSGLKINCKHKISYACSFGRTKIDSRYNHLFSCLFSEFKNISVREESSLSIVKELGYQGCSDIDPTLLLSCEEWIDAVKKYSRLKMPKNKYVLKYVLGDEKKSDFFIQHDEIIDVLDPTSPYYCINHFDFIKLILNAEYILTNSFHASVFSILFAKSFYLLKGEKHRQDMFNRFDLIFQLVDNIYENVEGAFYIDGHNVDLNKLDVLRNRSLNNLFKYTKPM